MSLSLVVCVSSHANHALTEHRFKAGSKRIRGLNLVWESHDDITLFMPWCCIEMQSENTHNSCVSFTRIFIQYHDWHTQNKEKFFPKTWKSCCPLSFECLLIQTCPYTRVGLYASSFSQVSYILLSSENTHYFFSFSPLLWPLAKISNLLPVITVESPESI